MIFRSLRLCLRRGAGLAGVLCLLVVAAKAQSARPPALGDDAIRQAIQKRLDASKIRSNGFKVEVKNGIATLRGQTSVAQHKGVATRLAKLAGAREVDNQITITEAGKQRLRETLQRNKPAGGKATKPSKPAATPVSNDVAAGIESVQADRRPAGDQVEQPDGGDSGRSALPLFTVQPAKRGEARSERRRY